MSLLSRRGSSFVPTFPAFFTWDPFQVADELSRGEGAPQRRSSAGNFRPRFDVKETKEGYLFKADLPGVAEQDVDITVDGKLLTVSGKREEEKVDGKGDTFFLYERGYGAFTRSFTLPESADTQNLKADLKDGVLTLLVPKRPESQPRRISLSSK